MFFLAFYEKVDAESTYLFAEKVKEKLIIQEGQTRESRASVSVCKFERIKLFPIGQERFQNSKIRKRNRTEQVQRKNYMYRRLQTTNSSSVLMTINDHSIAWNSREMWLATLFVRLPIQAFSFWGFLCQLGFSLSIAFLQRIHKSIRNFFAHLSQRLKWAFLIKICPLSVVVVVVVVGVVVNISHFYLLQNHWANFNKT